MIRIFLISAFCILQGTIAFANCTNLSHQYNIGPGLFKIKQLGCEQFDRRTFDGTDQIGDPDIVELNGKWKTDHVDDTYDLFDRRIRWTWNASQTALVMESIVDGLMKGSNERYVVNRTDIYQKNDLGVLIDSYVQYRKELSDGTLSVTQSHKVLQAKQLLE